MRLPCSSWGAAAALGAAHAVSLTAHARCHHSALALLVWFGWRFSCRATRYLSVGALCWLPAVVYAPMLTSPFSSSASHCFHPLQRRRTPTSRMSPSPTSRRPPVSAAGALVATVHGSRGWRRWLAQQQGAGGTGQGAAPQQRHTLVACFLVNALMLVGFVPSWCRGVRWRCGWKAQGRACSRCCPSLIMCRRHCALHPLLRFWQASAAPYSVHPLFLCCRSTLLSAAPSAVAPSRM